MVKVHHFRVWDHAAGEMKTQPLKSSEERIARIGGEIIDGTAEEVPEDTLDDEGRYDPRRYGRGDYGSGAYGVSGGYGVAGAYGAGPFPSETKPLAMEGATPLEPQTGGGALLGEFTLNATALSEAPQVAAERHRRNTAAFIANATSGATQPIGPLVPTPASNQEPVAGTSPAPHLFIGDQDSAIRVKGIGSVVRERPAEIEAMARELAQEFRREIERARAQKSNEEPEEADAYIDFLTRMAASLIDLADSIHSAFVQPKSDEPIFAERIQEKIDAIGADYFEWLKANRHRVYSFGTSVGLYSVGALFLNFAGVDPGATYSFLSGLLLGQTARPRK